MTRLATPVTANDHRRGRDDAPIQLVEYGDFQCPSCGALYDEIQRLRGVAGDELLIVYRHFPLNETHAHAQFAAEAAEAAGAQGAFWVMHDALFENQEALDAGSVLGYAEALDLDVDQLWSDVQSRRFQSRVRADFLSGVRSGVSGTPSLFLNGWRYRGANTVDGILATLGLRVAAPW